MLDPIVDQAGKPGSVFGRLLREVWADYGKRRSANHDVEVITHHGPPTLRLSTPPWRDWRNPPDEGFPQPATFSSPHPEREGRQPRSEQFCPVSHAYAPAAAVIVVASGGKAWRRKSCLREKPPTEVRAEGSPKPCDGRVALRSGPSKSRSRRDIQEPPSPVGGDFIASHDRITYHD